MASLSQNIDEAVEMLRSEVEVYDVLSLLTGIDLGLTELLGPAVKPRCRATYNNHWDEWMIETSMPIYSDYCHRIDLCARSRLNKSELAELPKIAKHISLVLVAWKREAERIEESNRARIDRGKPVAEDDVTELRDHLISVLNARLDEVERNPSQVKNDSIEASALAAIVDGGLAGVLSAAEQASRGEKITATMRNMIKEDPKYLEWGVRQWADHFSASSKTINNCEGWREAMNKRGTNQGLLAPELSRLEKTEMRRRKTAIVPDDSEDEG